jgi:hypothetical protein
MSPHATTPNPMDEAKRADFQRIGDECDGLFDDVESAYDEHATFQQKYQTRIKVEELVKQFREAVTRLDEMERLQIERTVGRKIVDLQKMAVNLPAPPSGKPVEKKAELQFFETREGKSSRQPITIGAGAIPRDAPKYRVTGEVEAWCGPCADMKTHVIAAMVGDQPAQVVCQACFKSHKYRPGPPDKAKKLATRTSATYKPSAGEIEAQRKTELKKKLLADIEAAQVVRPFSPRERYKAGEVIEHPEYGRGKIESVLPRSLMVRFPIGLRPVKLT